MIDMEQILVTERIVKANKELKCNQKATMKANKKVKGGLIKSKISKLTRLDSDDSYLDLVGDTSYGKDEKLVATPKNLNELLECLEHHHVCGMSGSGFPTIEKVNTLITSQAPSKYLVINAVACDPALLHDDWLLHNRLEQIEKGIHILRRFITFDEAVLATKLDITKYNQNADYRICRVPDRYPMGEERILIQHVLDRKIPQDKVPAHQGILILNVQTIYAVYQAAYRDKCLDSRLLTVADLNNGEAVIVRAAVGTKIGDIATKVWNGFRDRGNSFLVQNHIYYGGGIMGAKEAAPNDVVSLNTNLIAVGSMVQLNNEARCKGCGACKKNCPMGVNVAKAVKAIEKGDSNKAVFYGAQSCIQCGACSYFCHAGKNTMRIIGEWKEQQKNK